MENKDCYFCKRNIQKANWKNTDLLRRFITSLGKIRSRRQTGLCARHQRRVSKAIKRARQMGFLSPTSKH